MADHFVRDIFLTTFISLHMRTSMASLKDVPESGTLTEGVWIECTADSSSSAVNSILSDTVNQYLNQALESKVRVLVILLGLIIVVLEITLVIFIHLNIFAWITMCRACSRP